MFIGTFRNNASNVCLSVFFLVSAVSWAIKNVIYKTVNTQLTYVLSYHILMYYLQR